MKTVIYLDELLLTNFLAAAMLLLCTGLLCARQCSGLRLLAGSAAAAAFSLCILLPELPGAAAVLCKVFTCGAVVAAAYGVPGLRGFVRLCTWYLLLNLLLCGAVVLPGVQSANLCVYFALSPGRLLLCCGAVSALLRVVLFCFGRAGPRSVAAVLELDSAALPVQALCDTGFSVQDPLSGRRPAAGAADLSGQLLCLRRGTAAGAGGAAGALHHHCRTLCAACGPSQSPARGQPPGTGLSGCVLPPGNAPGALDRTA